MFTGGRARGVSEVDDLMATFQALREANAALRDTCARNALTAARARENATRTCADAKRARGELFHVELPREANSGALARGLVEHHLDTLLPEDIANAKTVVSELVNNAVVHGHGAIALRVSKRRGRIRVDVKDEGKHATIRAGSADRPHGLDIVNALSLTWGAREGSTHVWAELRARPPVAD
jgi:hypothetical protein